MKDVADASQNRESLIQGLYAVVTSEKRTNSATGQPFLTGQLRNRERALRFIAGKGLQGSDGGPVSAAELSSIFEEGQIVEIAGKLGEYKGEPQIEIRSASVVPQAALDPTEFLPRSTQSDEVLRKSLYQLIGLIPSPLQEIVIQVLEPNYRVFSTWPAAKMYHHAWIGGLLEHSIEVARTALDIAAPVWDGVSDYDGAEIVFENRIRRWPTVDVGLLLAVALLHDVGKMEELTVAASTSYSDAGQVLGHIHLGLFAVRDQCVSWGLDAFDTNRLLHCIASHHGLPEFGSAVFPLTAEAIILNLADEASAKLAMVGEALESDSTDLRGWSDWNKPLNRRIWLQAARFARDQSGTATEPIIEDLPF